MQQATSSLAQGGPCPFLPLILGIALGCSSESSSGAGAPPRYHEDVAPLLAEHCVGCHQAGGIAPFALTDLEGVRARAAQIAAVTEARIMPPMPVDNGGSCNTYSNARWLTEAEIDLLRRWAAAGGPAGTPSGTPTAAAQVPQLDTPDARLEPGADYVPRAAEGEDDYRCFVLPAAAGENTFLTDYQISPGDERVVHHVIVYQPAGEAAAAAAQALDDAEPELGYTCFGGPRIAASPLALWAPGSHLTRLPEGTGLPLAGGRRLVMQVHYNLTNGSFPDRTQLALRLTTAPVIPASHLLVANVDLLLPPGREHVASESAMVFEPPVSFSVHGAMPHMHTLGRTLRAEAQAGGESRCLVNVDRWDFHWQNAWWYETPLPLGDVRQVAIRCGFDTRARSESVAWGDATSDEMCLSYFYVTTRDEPEPPISCANTANPLFGSCVERFLSGCYEPDTGGECRAEAGGATAWQDGSRFVLGGAGAGFYAAGQSEPCIAITAGEGGLRLERGAESIAYSPGADRITIGCPDGAQFEVSRFHFREFGACRGLFCPP